MGRELQRPAMDLSTKKPLRFITAASLFDGHDASINIMRRLLQEKGMEVIHLGHNRSVRDIVVAALQEGAHAVAISSYQGGHLEYFKYLRDLLVQEGASYVRIFGGGGGVIIPSEKAELEAYGITQIFHPEDGRRMGLNGMIDYMIEQSNPSLTVTHESFQPKYADFEKSNPIPHCALGLALSEIENESLRKNLDSLIANEKLKSFQRKSQDSEPLVLGITGTGGAGKSSLIDELVQRFVNYFPGIKVGVFCVDPTKQKTGGALLGDRIRMNSLSQSGVYMRSLASRNSGSELSEALPDFLQFCKRLDFDLLIAESSGIGQASSKILQVADFSLYVMTSEFGAQSQLEKIDMIDYANFIAINKADHRGSFDALRDVKKQFKRSHKIFSLSENQLPIYLTQASRFNDSGVNDLFWKIVDEIQNKQKPGRNIFQHLKSQAVQENQHQQEGQTHSSEIVPSARQNYLAEIVACLDAYRKETEKRAQIFSQWGAWSLLSSSLDQDLVSEKKQALENQFPPQEWDSLQNWDVIRKKYDCDEFSYEVRNQQVKQPMKRKSLSGLNIPRVVFPQISDWGDRYRFLRKENLPGHFPFTAGVFQLKREGEDPLRQFAGEGSPERTNKRFHFLSETSQVKRLSTAFDSVTLYGQDPASRPDIFGKVGESGVSISTLDDMKKLYEGFDLCDPKTSVSMTINGPAPMILAFYLNTAIDQQLTQVQFKKGKELTADEIHSITSHTLKMVRGTVQADILKEDQGQNTCIFSIEFALRLMGDVQEFFIENDVRNFYSVSISGYHIAEAGANPITQLALTLSNAFTYVEYYLARGMKIDDFAPNLSFFFSNGLDPEYTVIGRVARRIWAVVIRDLYKGNERSQKLKYHIQTSGRSLHAQEMDFNDIRTTLQALIAISDNCNSLHTNAFDEAITTPTEASVRRAQAIQMIINKELGSTKNENGLQGSYFVEWLTDEVEDAVLKEFLRLNERGGVLGAMETQYQRSKIQEESLHYEHLKHSGELPIIGVNTFFPTHHHEKQELVDVQSQLARATETEKKGQLSRCREFKAKNQNRAQQELALLKEAALTGKNIFAALMRTSRYCSLQQMTEALFAVGGEYRRNI